MTNSVIRCIKNQDRDLWLIVILPISALIVCLGIFLPLALLSHQADTELILSTLTCDELRNFLTYGENPTSWFKHYAENC